MPSGVYEPCGNSLTLQVDFTSSVLVMYSSYHQHILDGLQKATQGHCRYAIRLACHIVQRKDAAHWCRMYGVEPRTWRLSERCTQVLIYSQLHQSWSWVHQHTYGLCIDGRSHGPTHKWHSMTHAWHYTSNIPTLHLDMLTRTELN